MYPLIIIAGPTAVGKTEFAIWLAERLQAEIISADSMQVYRFMNIGTAKPSPEEQKKIKHHLIDLVNPNQDFSVADYRLLFDKTVQNFQVKGKLALVVGGTGLYIRASLRSFPFRDPGANPELRLKLQQQAETSNNPIFLYQKLEKIDPVSAARIHPNDQRRIIRALEVYFQTGTPLSSLLAVEEGAPRYRSIYLFLDRDREELYQRIDQRVEQMLKAGLIAEVQDLLARGYSSELKAMQSLGYKQVNDYLKGIISLDEAVNSTKQLSRHYAKRQLTWFRKEPVDYWVNISGKSKEFFGEILNYIEGRMGSDVE